MRKTKLWLAMVACVCFSVAAQTASTQKKIGPSRLSAYRGNQCVSCHANLTEPLSVSAHFFEWLGSKHEKQGVSCDKCHGGDPAAKDWKTAHSGMLNATNPQSRLHPQNLSNTCNSCHQDVVTAFTRSKHFLALQNTGAGPSCTTCHQHMATAVITWPPATAALCTNCHNQNGGAASNYLNVPKQATDAIASFSRADEVIDWAWHLINENSRRAPRYQAEQTELKRLAVTVKAAKLSWHEFNLTKSRQDADRAFFEATKTKNKIK